jgi:hypothetical protein
VTRTRAPARLHRQRLFEQRDDEIQLVLDEQERRQAAF